VIQAERKGVTSAVRAATIHDKRPLIIYKWICWEVKTRLVENDGHKKSPPEDDFSSEALAFHKIEAGTSSRRWRSVARGYWQSLYKRS
jgi:hypothetical protein